MFGIKKERKQERERERERDNVGKREITSKMREIDRKEEL